MSASCAAVLAVYVAGYVRTQSAANRFAVQIAERRVAVPDPQRAASPIAEFPPAAPNASVAAPTPAPAISSGPARDAAGQHNQIASAESIPATDNASAALRRLRPPRYRRHSRLSAVVALPEAILAAAPPAPIVEPKPDVAPAAPPAPMWKDGTYTGWGTSRHGDIQAAVVIEGGRIASATIAQCRTRYSCSVIERLPPQVAQRQSPDVDYVSGATQSANAFYYAVVDALSKAK